MLRRRYSYRLLEDQRFQDGTNQERTGSDGTSRSPFYAQQARSRGEVLLVRHGLVRTTPLHLHFPRDRLQRVTARLRRLRCRFKEPIAQVFTLSAISLGNGMGGFSCTVNPVPDELPPSTVFRKDEWSI